MIIGLNDIKKSCQLGLLFSLVVYSSCYSAVLEPYQRYQPSMAEQTKSMTRATSKYEKRQQRLRRQYLSQISRSSAKNTPIFSYFRQNFQLGGGKNTFLQQHNNQTPSGSRYQTQNKERVIKNAINKQKYYQLTRKHHKYGRRSKPSFDKIFR